MRHRPRSISLVGWLFVAVGCIGIVGHTWSRMAPPASTNEGGHGAESPLDFGLAAASGFIAILGGAGALRGFDWGRWLLAAWMVAHIGISALHSWFEMWVHVVLFTAVSIVLFRPRASAYFREAAAARRSGVSAFEEER